MTLEVNCNKLLTEKQKKGDDKFLNCVMIF